MTTLTLSKTVTVAGITLAAGLLTAIGLVANPLAAGSAGDSNQFGKSTLPAVAEDAESESTRPTAISLTKASQRPAGGRGATDASSGGYADPSSGGGLGGGFGGRFGRGQGDSSFNDDARPTVSGGAAEASGAERSGKTVRPTSIDLKSRRPTEQKIIAALDEQTDIEFVKFPLKQVLEHLADLHGIQIVIDKKPWRMAGSPRTRSSH